ncbi:MAG: response regulator transcription factor [Clostridia bacterium]|nr:response regulator transcription factor [Clostridia bacterium]
MTKTVLVVDDERPIVEILKFNLEKNGYRVLTAFDGAAGLELALSGKPDLILLDLMLPKMDGFDVCKELRKTSNVPILMLTAKDDELDKVLGLELGADDYITKPFGIREVLARVKRNLTRNAQETESPKSESSGLITYMNFSLDPQRYEVKIDGSPVDLTVREFELVKYLAMNPGQVFSREKLLESVWGYEYFGDPRTVDVTVRRVREKLEKDPANPVLIMTKRGVGYYFNKN